MLHRARALADGGSCTSILDRVVPFTRDDFSKVRARALLMQRCGAVRAARELYDPFWYVTTDYQFTPGTELELFSLSSESGPVDRRRLAPLAFTAWTVLPVCDARTGWLNAVPTKQESAKADISARVLIVTS